MVLTEETGNIVTTTCVAAAYSLVLMPDPRAKRVEGSSFGWFYRKGRLFKGHYLEPDQSHFDDPE